MESSINNSISVEIPNYSGPLETLLDLAKNQKVDLAEISVTILADQFLNYIKENKDLMNKILKIDFDSVLNPNVGSFYIILKKKNV